MKNSQLFSEAMRYNKLAVDSLFGLLNVYQSNSEAMMQNTFEKLNWFPELSKNSYLQWSENNRQAAAYLKSVVDAGFEQVESVLGQTVPHEVRRETAESAPQKAQTPVSKPTKTNSASVKTPAAPKAEAAGQKEKKGTTDQSHA
ncbi:MAG: hypothetical protein ACWGOX_11855 [Desulforhopalus sp.]